jgi:uncharacterized LabA/DUF88 family protein
MPSLLPPSSRPDSRVMMFVDGENLAKRYGAMLAGGSPLKYVDYERDVLVWSRYASRVNGPQDFIRRYYYTSCAGDEPRRDGIATRLRALGIEAPRVFPRVRGGRSKRVDITLATDMLTHAHRRNFDIAVLVAGDEDYVPLVQAVQAEGRRVALWFVSDGLSGALRNAADHFWNIGELLLEERERSLLNAIYGSA